MGLARGAGSKLNGFSQPHMWESDGKDLCHRLTPGQIRSQNCVMWVVVYVLFDR